MPQKVKNKITSQCMLVCIVYYLQSILSVLLPLFYPPPSFLLPFPLLLSYFVVATTIAVEVAVLIALAFLIALALLVELALLAAAVACCACACTSWWVRAALVRDLVLRTSCLSGSSDSCWDALTCSTASSTAASSSSAPTPSSHTPKGGPGGRGRGGGRPVGPLAHHWQRPKTSFKPIPRQPRRIQKYVLNVTALTPQGKKQYLCGVISKRYDR